MRSSGRFFSMAWPPQVRIALTASALAFSITVYCAAYARSTCSLVGLARASLTAWNHSALVCSSMMCISATAICLVGNMRRLAAQIGDGEVVGRLGEPHIGRRQGEKHVRPRGRGTEIDAVWHEHGIGWYEHILENQGTRYRCPHAERVPVARHDDAGRIGRNGEIERVAAARRLAFVALRAQHPVIVGSTRERSEDLLAVDDEAILDRPRLRAKGRRAGGGSTPFRERLRVDRALLHDAAIVNAPALIVRGPLLRRH